MLNIHAVDAHLKVKSMLFVSTGEFTPETQLRLKAEEEKEQKELDPWKAKHFEPVWGQRWEMLSFNFCI
jgi:hypothetical protein